MQLAKVIGRATATIKHQTLEGTKMLLVQPMLADGKAVDGYPQLAVDTVGSGIGETVILTSDGRHARDFLKADATPVRWTIIGIRDEG